MIICSCKAVSDRRIRAELDSGARTVGDLARRCGAGSNCGSCVEDLAALVKERRSILDLPQMALAAK